MRFVRDFLKGLRDTVVPAVCALALAYFGYHAVTGERGLLSWLQVSQEVDEAEARLASLSGEREEIEGRVALLRPGALDPDMLDERVRLMLNLARPDEVVITRPKFLFE